MTSGVVKEAALETVIEDHLAGTGYIRLKPAAFDRDLCVFPDACIDFIQATQSKLWKYFEENLNDPRKEILPDLGRALDAGGTLTVLRDGFKVKGKAVRMAYWQPTSNANPDTLALYGKNTLGVTRQLRYSSKHDNEIDIVLSLNGLPVVSAELKNQFTGQNVFHAMKQYRDDRSSHDTFFGPKDPTKAPARCLVNFAVDPFEAYYATKLQDTSTFFLPFNKGADGGKGNPPPPAGKYGTHYLWEETWSRDSILDILHRFLWVERKEIKSGSKVWYKETLIHPRFHQIDVVRQLEAASRLEGPGNRYLVQHSAGSGKSNSIAWLSHRLFSLHDGDKRVFDAVVVITDRRILDKQLRDTIRQFEQTKGVVIAAEKDAKQLADALEAGGCIVVTTLQKFPFVTQHLADKLPDRKYAIVVDEAHSSQTGTGAAKMKEVLRGKSLEEAAALEANLEGASEEEALFEQAMSRGKAPNLSFYAFTATPKAKTLGMFGRAPKKGEKPIAFHVYSMRQAIEEGFILDVLKNYTTYKAYYRLVKTLTGTMIVDKDEAAKAVAQYAQLHPTAIAQKVRIIIEHFRGHILHQLGGRAKALVVTASRKHAVHYKLAMDEYLEAEGYTDVKTLVAFSGKVMNDGPHGDGKEYTEAGMNPDGVTETNLAKRFEEDYQVLLVAEKYQTGFDQPLLVAMYVDKKLEGVHAVQTLSRLNRTYAGKASTFILDFVNEPEAIQKAFQPFFETTTIDEEPDHAKLYALQASMMQAGIIEKPDVDAFAKIFFKSEAKQEPGDGAKLYALTGDGVKNYVALDIVVRDKFRNELKAYLHLYGYLTQLVEFHDQDLEKLYVYGRHLWKVLPKPPRADEVVLNDEIALKYLRVELKSEDTIELEKGKQGVVKHPSAMGTKTPKYEQLELNEVIEAFNARFEAEWTDADKLFLDSIGESAALDPDLREAATVNAYENFKIKSDKQMEQIIVDRQGQNEAIVTKIFEDKRFEKAVKSYLARRVFAMLNRKENANR